MGEMCIEILVSSLPARRIEWQRMRRVSLPAFPPCSLERQSTSRMLRWVEERIGRRVLWPVPDVLRSGAQFPRVSKSPDRGGRGERESRGLASEKAGRLQRGVGPDA